MELAESEGSGTDEEESERATPEAGMVESNQLGDLMDVLGSSC